MSERRNLERMTKTGRGVIHTRPASDAFRDGWERVFSKKQDKNNDGRDPKKSRPLGDQ